jgi:V8-like Glu-specific endopeptidase
MYKASPCQRLENYGEFSLIASEVVFNNAESVCGEDERIAVNPLDPYFEAICFLAITFSDGRQLRGTGFYINNGNTAGILTAGHCVCDNQRGGFASSISIIRGMDGSNQPFGSLKVDNTMLRATKEWIDSKSEEHDLGLIILSGEPWGFSCAHLEDEALRGAEARTAGYPADKKQSEIGDFHMWYDHGPINNVDSNRIFYMEDTFGGQSGSPIWTKVPRSDSWVVVGVHTYGGCPNNATRITKERLDLINSWLA